MYINPRYTIINRRNEYKDTIDKRGANTYGATARLSVWSDLYERVCLFNRCWNCGKNKDVKNHMLTYVGVSQHDTRLNWIDEYGEHKHLIFPS